MCWFCFYKFHLFVVARSTGVEDEDALRQLVLSDEEEEEENENKKDEDEENKNGEFVFEKE